ncbi:diacylglycerol kinase family lipid kinase [Kocuria coralli]|uniref:Diacylglycerol kinase family lipid kinase n=1 Tax=Kocuria coralli TaxID=1461025 RepID=A0A5J5KWV0_9MICC|nr:diacylglycerol kinase family protein [Kocuria coralli]KAA9394114.1 diacylglycerol kinase family lipid kinase [Kocuria coralli]
MVSTPSPQRVAVVINPSKYDADSARDTLVVTCRKAGWPDPMFLPTTVDDPGTSMTYEALAAGADVVLAAGGDGTVRTVAEILANTGTPLGVIPLGTGNLLARNLGAHLDDIHHSVDIALFGDQRRIDMVSFSTENMRGEHFTHASCVMGGAGFDAEIMTNTSEELKRQIGWMAYIEAGMRRITAEPVWTRYSIDDGPWQTKRLRSILAANCGVLTGGLVLVPVAKINDGRLDVVVIAPRGPLGWVTLTSKIIFKQRHDLPSMEHSSCRKVRVEFHKPTEAQIDGDGIGRITAFEAKIMPEALYLRVPPSQGDEANDLLA